MHLTSVRTLAIVMDMKNDKLSKAQKEAIVFALMAKAGDIVEYWTEQGGLDGIPADIGAAYICSLMRRMPGTIWDTRIPQGDK